MMRWICSIMAILACYLLMTPVGAFPIRKKQGAQITKLSSSTKHGRSNLLLASSKNGHDNSNVSTSATTSAATTLKRQKLIQATIAGLAVALAMVPEAIAFSFVAGVNPLVGLWTTVALGFTAAALGGRAGICSSASGACSVVVAALCRSHGPAYLSACAFLAGVLQAAAGLAGLGTFIRLVPHPVMLGFVNGLAVVMTRAQMAHFRSAGRWLSPKTEAGASMYGVALLTMLIVKILPKITTVLPPSLGAVIISTIITNVFQLPVKSLSDAAGPDTFKGGFSVIPRFGLPQVPFTFDTFQTVWPYALTMAAVGCIESLLTMQLLDTIADDGNKGSTKKECVGQGLGNVLTGLTGGIGGCALLGQSLINAQSGGGVSRWSGMSMAIFLAFGIVLAAPLLGTVPVASLVGVMLLVCHSTFSWSSLRLIHKIPKLDVFVIALVSIITVQKDLAMAVVMGTVASALGFAWKQSTDLTATTPGAVGKKQKVYHLSGPLFFGSTSRFTNIFQPKSDPALVVLDFTNSNILDHSALDAIQNLIDQYKKQGKRVALRNLSTDSAKILSRNGGELATAASSNP